MREIMVCGHSIVVCSRTGQGNEWCECDAARPDPAWGLLIALNFSSVASDHWQLAGAFHFQREEGSHSPVVLKQRPLSLDAFTSTDELN